MNLRTIVFLCFLTATTASARKYQRHWTHYVSSYALDIDKQLKSYLDGELKPRQQLWKLSEYVPHRIRHHPELEEEVTWPVKKVAVVEGDIILGGLMMVHEREDTITCGPVMPQGGIQALEAMLYTLDRVNREALLPNITLGAHILDDCDKDTYGLEMAVDFIKGNIENPLNLKHLPNVISNKLIIETARLCLATEIRASNYIFLFKTSVNNYASTSLLVFNKVAARQTTN